MASPRNQTELLQDIHNIQKKLLQNQGVLGAWNEVNLQTSNLTGALNSCPGDEDVYTMKESLKGIEEQVKTKIESAKLDVSTVMKELGMLREKYYEALRQEFKEEEEEPKVPELSDERDPDGSI